MTRKRNKRRIAEDQQEISVENKINQPFKKNSIQIISKIKPKSPNQEKLIESILNNQFTICAGRPGTGKTLLSCYESLKLLLRKDLNYNKIFLCKSVVPLSTTENIGFLKGSLHDKFENIAESFMDNFNKIIDENDSDALIENKIIVLTPVSFLRGRSLSDIVIVDECQNLSLEVLHTILTRIETGGKLILLGDIKQQDLKGNSGFETIIKHFKDVENFGVVELNEDQDVQRNPMINIIEKIFDNIFLKK